MKAASMVTSFFSQWIVVVVVVVVVFSLSLKLTSLSSSHNHDDDDDDDDDDVYVKHFVLFYSLLSLSTERYRFFARLEGSSVVVASFTLY
jgi:hypothetical protein